MSIPMIIIVVEVDVDTDHQGIGNLVTGLEDFLFFSAADLTEWILYSESI